MPPRFHIFPTAASLCNRVVCDAFADAGFCARLADELITTAFVLSAAALPQCLHERGIGGRLPLFRKLPPLQAVQRVSQSLTSAD